MSAITQWNRDERPREKLVDKGPQALSNAELIAILISTGGEQGRSALDISRDLCAKFDNSLALISSASLEALCGIRGIGIAKATYISAAFEIARRVCSEDVVCEPQIYTPEDAVRIMRMSLCNLQHEECWGLFLNRANRVIGRERFSIGGSSSTSFDIKIIAKRLVEKMASGLILVHNHPSGNVSPGMADINQTEELQRALNLFDILLVDHIIIGKHGFYSFKEAGKLE